MKPYSLYERVSFYQAAFPTWPLLVAPNGSGDLVITGTWFLGGGRHSDYYGSYHKNYLDRIATLFPDAERIVHLFGGSIPPGPYVRVDSNPKLEPDVVANAEELATSLSFTPDLIYADPPYSIEDAQHYQTGLINRPKVVDECGSILQPGGYLVWLDQALPVFSGRLLRLVGLIGYIRSTGNRFRCVSIFWKPVSTRA